jgi:hypothetical protein
LDDGLTGEGGRGRGDRHGRTFVCDAKCGSRRARAGSDPGRGGLEVARGGGSARVRIRRVGFSTRMSQH